MANVTQPAAGVLVLRDVERRLDVGGRLAACIADDRQPGRVRHNLADVIRFRMLDRLRS